MPADAPDALPGVVLTCADTGASVELPSALLLAPAALRTRILRADVQGAWAGAADAEAVRVDVPARTYRFARYPPLSFFADLRLVVVLGAFFVAGCAQVFFFFPCLPGFSLVMPAGAPAVSATNPGFCVDVSALGALPAAPSAAALRAVASARIAVTLQTFAVMFIGAVAGRAGGLAAVALYVAMVCVGAPFGASSGGVGKAVWEKGGVVSVSGGFFWGFMAAALIMGRAAERGAGRGGSWRSAAWLVPHMLCAEAAIYACGLTWYPFGKAYAAGVAVTATPVLGCSAAAGGAVGASQCLYTIANALMVPFLPGECFKMLMVLLLVPLCWAALLRVHKWRYGGGDVLAGGYGDEETGEVARKESEQAALALRVGAPEPAL
jgi:biotin transport system substrate-specific component